VPPGSATITPQRPWRETVLSMAVALSMSQKNRYSHEKLINVE
jgi:hypothetical protein